MPGLANIDIVCADDQAIRGGTFQSHNQKVVSNRNGIFMTHIRGCNEAFTAQPWRLSWSKDGGKTFSALYEAVEATNPPALETDEADNLYLARPDFLSRDAHLFRFQAADGYARPLISKIEGGSAGKSCMMYDGARGQLYYFAHNGTFHVVGLDGGVRRSQKLLVAGPTAIQQYPHLSLELDGTLHAAWTTNKNDQYLYTDIHYMKSVDGGETWRKMDGTRLDLPVIADYHGPSDQINLDDEYDYHTWLSSFMVKNGKLHFVYKYTAPGDAARQHYVRYDLKTARREIDLWPEFKGETISLCHNDGFFASRASDPGSPLYCILAQDGHIACLRSEDNGDTWHDHAISERRFASHERMFHPYAIGGCREVTADGYIIGSFTDRVPHPDRMTEADFVGCGGVAPVYFFKIRAGRT